MLRVKVNNSLNPALLNVKEIILLKLLGSGAHGKVYSTDLENVVIKIYNTNTENGSINMEYTIFKKLLEYTDKNYPPNMVKALGRGELTDTCEFDGNMHLTGDKFTLVPLYQKFYDIQTKHHRLQKITFIVEFISILLKVAVFLERQLKIVHLDIKTGNLMYDKDKELILIDLGLVENIEHGQEIYVPDKKYYIWPHESCFLVAIPVYSIAICVMEFFYGKLKIWQIQSIDDVQLYVKSISKKSKHLGNILSKMISLKYDPSTVLKYIEIKYKSDLEIYDKDLDIPNTSIKPDKKSRKKHSINKWFHTIIQQDLPQE